MVSDILSQDEIDRLLNATGGDDAPSGGAPAGGGLDPSQAAHVFTLVSPIFAAAKSTIDTLIARESTISQGSGSTGAAADVDSGKNALIKAPFRSGFKGEIYFLIEVGAAASIADMILGGEGEAKDELEEADIDAVQELIGQVLGNAAPNISSAISVEVGFDSVSTQIVEEGTLKDALGADDIYQCPAGVKIGDALDTSVTVLMSTATASEIAGAISPAPEPAPAPSFAEPAAPAAPTPAAAAPAAAPAAAAHGDIGNIDLILDIEVEVMVRLGNAEMSLRDIQKLRPGSIIDLDRDTDALVELVVNDRTIAKGELVVVSSDHFALRVTEIQTPTERIRSLGGE